MATESNGVKNKICETIKKFRFMKRMSARELALKTGIAPSNLSAIEKGERVPKLDMCNKIANALGVDPVELCGLELTEVDEKRLLMKLLTKYADKIEIAKVEDENGEKYDSKGRSIVTLPIEFADFTLRYTKHIDDVKFAVDGIDKSSPKYELLKANAEDELNYWLDMYPVYDAVSIAKHDMELAAIFYDDTETEEEHSNNAIDFDLVNTTSSLMYIKFKNDFWFYQSEYIIPNRNAEWRAKHTNRDDE